MNEAEIRKVCVIGAGTMGGGIAAHLVNLGFEVTLLDATTEDAFNGLERLKQSRPPSFFLNERAGDIRLGNIVDHSRYIAEADWVCEAIVENLIAKKELFAGIQPLIKPDALISSNTSGIPLANISAGLGTDFQRRFLGIHFFNPPRYLKLIELIPTSGTSPEIVKLATRFLEDYAARRVVPAKDVPGFIANRFGMWSLYQAIHTAEKLGMPVELVDAFTGPLIGRPKSATFRLADVIGLDVMRDIGNNLRVTLTDDPHTSTFDVPASMLSLLGRGWIGDKAGHGYYQREGKETMVLDFANFAYRMPLDVQIPELEHLMSLPLGERLQEALAQRSELGEYLRASLIPTLRYAEAVKEQVSFSILDFDRVMKWGFGWELGPFELIDQIGPENLGLKDAPPNYRSQEYRDFSGIFHRIPKVPEFETLADFKEIDRGETYRLRDLGDGVIAVSLTTKMGVISPKCVEELTGLFEHKLDRYVLTSEARSFSAGFDIRFLNEAIAGGEFDAIDKGLEALQKLGELISKKSGAACVFGHCLGAGLELALSTSVIVVDAESRLGLPESRLGLIPSGRGVILMKENNAFNARRIAEVTLTLAQGTVAQNADQARQLGYLRSDDKTVYDADRLLFIAKQAALDAKPIDEPLWKPGIGPLVGMIDEGIAKLKATGGFTEYDELIAGKLRQIVARSVSYQDALARERLEFLDLCKRNLSQTRLRHMIEHGTALRN